MSVDVAPCTFGENIQTKKFNIYTINEVIIQTQKYLFSQNSNSKKLSSEENKVPSTVFEDRKGAGVLSLCYPLRSVYLSIKKKKSRSFSSDTFPKIT